MRNWLKKLGMLFIGLSRHGDGVATHLTKTGARDFSMEKFNAFVEGVEIEEDGLHLNQEEIDTYCEQYLYRKLSCAGCLSQEGCPHCECPFPLKMQTPDQECDAGEWGVMMSNKDWKEYKQKHNISFTLNFGYGD